MAQPITWQNINVPAANLQGYGLAADLTNRGLTGLGNTVNAIDKRFTDEAALAKKQADDVAKRDFGAKLFSYTPEGLMAPGATQELGAEALRLGIDPEVINTRFKGLMADTQQRDQYNQALQLKENLPVTQGVDLLLAQGATDPTKLEEAKNYLSGLTANQTLPLPVLTRMQDALTKAQSVSNQGAITSGKQALELGQVTAANKLAQETEQAKEVLKQAALTPVSKPTPQQIEAGVVPDATASGRFNTAVNAALQRFSPEAVKAAAPTAEALFGGIQTGPIGKERAALAETAKALDAASYKADVVKEEKNRILSEVGLTGGVVGSDEASSAINATLDKLNLKGDADSNADKRVNVLDKLSQPKYRDLPVAAVLEVLQSTPIDRSWYKSDSAYADAVEKRLDAYAKSPKAIADASAIRNATSAANRAAEERYKALKDTGFTIRPDSKK